MRLLAIDSTSHIATAALFQDGDLIAEKEADASRKHAETLLPLIDELLEESGISISQIDLFAADIGPGSFTGVRIGVSLVNALASATGKKIVPVDALLALSLSSKEERKPVCAMIDARNGNAYAALYQAKKTLIEPSAVEIKACLPRLPEDTIFVGDVNSEHAVFPRAKEIGLAALERIDSAQDSVEPLYLRPSQAERMREKSEKEA